MTKTNEELIDDRIRELWEKTDFLSALFEAVVGYAIIAADFDGNVLAYSDGARRMYGYAPEEVIGRRTIELFFPDEFIEAGQLQQVIDDVIRRRTFSCDVEKIRKGGERFPAHIVLTVTSDRQGKVVGFIEMTEDLTERKRAEQAEADARVKAERVEELERELRALERIAAPSDTAVTARTFGLVPLREAPAGAFDELLQHYGDLLEIALEQRAYKVEHDVSGELRALAERMGLLHAGPRDAVEIHSTALRAKMREANHAKAKAYADEGRMMVLELMGHLASFYRSDSLGLSRPPPPASARAGNSVSPAKDKES